MNKRSKAKREKRGQLLERNEELLNLAETEERDLTEEEQTEYDNNVEQIETLERQIEDLEEHERRMADAEKLKRSRDRANRKTDEQKLQQRFSITRAISAKMEGRSLDGAESEVHEEGVKEMRAANLNPGNGVVLPSSMIQIGNSEQRSTMAVGTPTLGGNTVETELRETIPYLYPRLRVEELGATMLTGLTGNIDMPEVDGVTTAQWAGENDAAQETNLTVAKKSLTPNRLTAFVPISRQLLIQSNESVDGMVRRDLSFSIAKAVDLAAINGSGAGNQPLGILNLAGLQTVTLGDPDGGAPTRDGLIDLTNLLEVANADMGNLGFLTTPGVRAKLGKTKLDAGSGRFVWENPQELLGYKALVSTQVPSNITKGASGATLHAIIFANWQEWLIGQWGGAEIIADPYTGLVNNIVKLVVHSYWDMLPKHTASFAAIKDASVA